MNTPFIRVCIAALTFFAASAEGVRAQVSTAPTEGLHDNLPRVHALINARLVIAPGKVVERGCLVVRDGLIADAGPDVSPPADARVWDLQGKTIYAGFIDAYFKVTDKFSLAISDPGCQAWINENSMASDKWCRH